MSTIIQTPVRNEFSQAAATRVPLETRKFRPDIEGLRAIAVLLVVIYHAHLLGMSGGFIGVDIFFVISGFLITRQLVAGVARNGIRELPAFYARRIRRLLPASTVVVVSTVVASYIWAPALRTKTITVDAIYTTFYGLNYHLAQLGTDYQHQTDAVSPLQHFWSLGVEEQFYIVWPILIVAASLTGARLRTPALVFLLTTMGTVSFWWSATTTVAEPSWAYFSLHTRAWELAVGGLVSLSAIGWARLPRWLTNVGAWAAVVTIIAAAYTLDDNSVYPGYLAAIPVLSAALLLGCGCAARFHSIERLLGEPVIQGIGKVSYSWYLWHWPMLIIFPYVAGEALGWPRRLEVVFLALLFAIGTYFLVENPARNLKRTSTDWFQVGVVLAGVVVVVSVVASNTVVTTGTGIAAQAVTITADSTADKKVHLALNDALTLTKAPVNLTPEPSKAATDFPIGCITQITDTSPDKVRGGCVFGDPKATETIAMFGDSHVQQWGTGFNAAAKKLHYRIVMRAKSACPLVDMPVYNSLLKREYRECTAWRPQAIAELIAMKPALVIMSQADAIAGPDTADHVWANATARTITKFRDAGIKVVFFADTPLIPFDVPQCIAEHLDATNKCSLAKGPRYVYPTRHAATVKAAKKAGATVVDPLQWFCTTQGCPAIVGNILVYRDNVGHMTSTYSKWLSPVLTNLLISYKHRAGPGT